MSNFVNYNAEIIRDNGKIIPVNNRSFRYGDGIFESIRIANGKIINVENHYKRLIKSASILKIKLSQEFSQKYFCKQILDLTEKNNQQNAARVRFSLFRNNDGFYKPLSDKALFLIESMPLENSRFELNENGINLGIYREIYKNYNLISSLKTCNALIYVLASVYALNNDFDDCLLLNQDNNILEATSSNIFLVNGKSIHTCRIEDGCVDGTMRNVIIELAEKAGFNMNVRTIQFSELNDADEIFLTNAITGINWVKNCNRNQYDNSVSSFLLKKLNDKLLP
ncbi:MAG: aminotransferase class IV [Bacteroidota bacterium]